MKYLLIVDDQYVKKYDNSTPYVTAVLEDYLTIKLIVTPLQREMLVMPNGASAYLTQGHIDAMMEYEREQHIKEIVDKMNHSLDGINDVDLPKRVPLITPEEVKRQFGLDGKDKIQGFTNGITMEDDKNG